VSAEERQTLEKLSRESNKNVSDLMREALQVMVRVDQGSTNDRFPALLCLQFGL
jgi:hypothetical protein